jgi:hypothetical protein
MTAGLADWGGFFTAEVGAAAALIGFLAVAISINLPRILSYAPLPGRAAEALMGLVSVMVIASIGLMPKLTDIVFGALDVAVSAAVLVIVLVIQWRSPPPTEREPKYSKPLRRGLALFGSLPLIVGGALLIVSAESGFDLIAFGIIASLVTGIFTSWVLLVEILR